jgi:anaerobic magnesium-protoporphyrin IX monomethyl ester cyclase
MNFTFINPPHEISKNNIWSIINSRIPPFGVALLSAIWDEQGHTSQIIDAAVLELNIPDIIARINPSSDFVGITATTPGISGAVEIARNIRRKLPNAKIIMGGAHPTIFHEELVRDNICDMVVRNEGEIPMTELAKSTPLNLIPNLTWRNSKGEVIINPGCSKYVELDNLPFPAYHKLPMHLYHSALGAARQSPSIGMVTSRGCPGKCTFCFSEMFGPQIRFMSPARIVAHIEHLQKNYGIGEISFYDDTFTANRENVSGLCELILSKKIRISWSCFARVDMVTQELLLLMKKAGCHQIMYGFETVDENILKNINKRTTMGQFKNAIAWTRAVKINVRGAFMLGNPGETSASMGKTIHYAKNAGIQFAVFNITTPYPGTQMYKEFSGKNLILHQNWDLYNLAQPILKLDTVSGETVKQYYYKSYRDFYLRPFFILQHILAIRTFAQFLMYMKAVFKITALLGRNIFFKTKIVERKSN